MIKDLIEILPFLQRYPTRVKLLVVSWVADVVLLIIGFAFAPHRPAQMDYIQLFQSKPTWIQIWSTVCLLHAVAAFISLVLFKPARVKEQPVEEHRPAKEPQPMTVTIPKPAPEGQTLPLEEIERQKWAVKGRFAEEERLRKKLHGARVVCSCTVENVSDNVSLTAQVWIDPGNGVHESHTLFISYAESFATQAFALLRGDRVRITGILDNTYDFGRDFKIEGEQLDFVKAAEQG